MISLLELNKIIGLNDTENSVLITLLDGRCALVDKKSRHVVVEILVDSFYKWMNFPNKPTNEDEVIIKDILKYPHDVGFGPCAKRYLTDEQTKQNFDKLKKIWNTIIKLIVNSIIIYGLEVLEDGI